MASQIWKSCSVFRQLDETLIEETQAAIAGDGSSVSSSRKLMARKKK